MNVSDPELNVVWATIESNKILEAARRPALPRIRVSRQNAPHVSSLLPPPRPPTKRCDGAQQRKIMRRKRKQVQPAPPDMSSLAGLIARQNMENLSKLRSGKTHMREQVPTIDRAPTKVSFAPTVRIRTIRHIRDYDNDEINDLWYSSKDLANIRDENIHTVRMTVKGVSFDEDLFSFRGLEHKTREGCNRRKENRAQGVLKTVSYHRLQSKLGLEDADYLAKMCSEASYISKGMALELGIVDSLSVSEG